ncbi:MAG: hypothetical protein ACOC0P_00765 [Planctomycetota bacterium]
MTKAMRRITKREDLSSCERPGSAIGAALAIATAIATAIVTATATAIALPGPSRFATEVIEYSPAPGQWVTDPDFNDPVRALGAPIGGGTLFADLSKLVSLGGFGGTLVLGFDRTIWDHPWNAHGVDAIVFGNGLHVGFNPNIRFAEAATIEISRDVNNNGRADDPWYLIPGSDITDPAMQQRDGFFILPDDPYAEPPIANPNTNGEEAFWGYADLSPVLRLGDLDGDNLIEDPSISPDVFYSTPDDPWSVGISPGSGGGDGFDIASAVDPITGAPANLDGFDFIRITTAVDAELVGLGEVSAEIGGVSAVRPLVGLPGDLDRDGDRDRADYNQLVALLGTVDGEQMFDPAADLNVDAVIDDADLRLFRYLIRGVIGDPPTPGQRTGVSPAPEPFGG